MDALQEQFDKVICNFLNYLETQDEVYVGVKNKYKEWRSNQQTSLECHTDQIKQHCQYTFKKGKMKDTLCLKKTEDGQFCLKHSPKKETKGENSETKKCIYVMTSGKRCSKNATGELAYCTVHSKKISNEETDFAVPDIPVIPELMA